jgi:hypothetical protein
MRGVCPHSPIRLYGVKLRNGGSLCCMVKVLEDKLYYASYEIMHLFIFLQVKRDMNRARLECYSGEIHLITIDEHWLLRPEIFWFCANVSEEHIASISLSS